MTWAGAETQGASAVADAACGAPRGLRPCGGCRLSRARIGPAWLPFESRVRRLPAAATLWFLGMFGAEGGLAEDEALDCCSYPCTLSPALSLTGRGRPW